MKTLPLKRRLTVHQRIRRQVKINRRLDAKIAKRAAIHALMPWLYPVSPSVESSPATEDIDAKD